MSSPTPVEATPDGQSRTATGPGTGAQSDTPRDAGDPAREHAGDRGAVAALLALQQADAAEVAGRLHDGIAQSLTGLLLVVDGLIGADPSRDPDDGRGLALVAEGLRAAREELAQVGRHLLRPTRHPTRPDLAIHADLLAGRHPVPSPSPGAPDVTASVAATTLARTVVHHTLIALAGTVQVVSVGPDGPDQLGVVVGVAGADPRDDDPRLSDLTALVEGSGGRLVVTFDEGAAEVVASIPADLRLDGSDGP